MKIAQFRIKLVLGFCLASLFSPGAHADNRNDHSQNFQLFSHRNSYESAGPYRQPSHNQYYIGKGNRSPAHSRPVYGRKGQYHRKFESPDRYRYHHPLADYYDRSRFYPPEYMNHPAYPKYDPGPKSNGWLNYPVERPVFKRPDHRHNGNRNTGYGHRPPSR